MVRVSLKNTFLSFDEGDDSEVANLQKSASPRSRSAECVGSPPRMPEELTERQLQRLLDMNLQRLPPAVGSRTHSPQSSSPRALSPRQIAAQRQQASSAGSSPPTKPASSTMMWLSGGNPYPSGATEVPMAPPLPQNRLSQQIQSNLRYVGSNGSLCSAYSTMSPEMEDGGRSPGSMPHAWSSNSISSMASGDFIDDQPGTVEFDLNIEEEGPLKPQLGPGVDRANNGTKPHGQPGEQITSQMMELPLEPQQASKQEGSFAPPNSDGKERLAHQQARNLPKEYRHGRVPKNFDLAEEFRSSNSERPATTLMIRNIPNRYTQRELILELEAQGFAGTFDFLYAPLDKGTMSNVGYAFVNFIDNAWASKCMETFHGYRFKRHRKASGKIAAVSIAHIQGLEANLAHYKNAAVNTAKLKQRRPLVMANISNSLLGAIGAIGDDEEEQTERL